MSDIQQVHEAVTESETLEHLDWAPRCDSKHCEERNRGTHTADWVILLSCGHSGTWCNRRFIEYGQFKRGGGSIFCAVNPSGHPTISVVSWAPIRG